MPRLISPLGSVRRLTLANVAVLALVLMGLGLAFRYTVQANLLGALDRNMQTRARRTVGRWERLGNASQSALVARERLHPNRRLRRVFRPEPLDVTNDSAANSDETDDQPLEPVFRSKVLDLQGRDYIAQIPDAPWDGRTFTQSAAGREAFSTLSIQQIPVRVLSVPLRRNGQVVGVVQIAHALNGVRYEVWTITRSLLTLIPLALLAVGLSGALLTAGAIRPVRMLRQAAARIGAQNLSERLPASGGDEFADLAAAFNGTLDRLENAFEQQRRFTSDASHELRTPLTVIRGNASLALAKERAAPEYRQALERVRRVAETMSGTIDDLLLLARADVGQLPLDLAPTSVAAVLEAAREATAAQNAPSVLLPLPPTNLQVQGNAAQLIRLFANLFSNAVRHTPRKGRITVQASAQEGEIVVTVQDTGEGIAPEHLPHVRERFYRADAARTQETGGAGLGLAISQSIVQAHGGLLEIESVLGLGTVVRVRLPRAIE